MQDGPATSRVPLGRTPTSGSAPRRSPKGTIRTTLRKLAVPLNICGSAARSTTPSTKLGVARTGPRKENEQDARKVRATLYTGSKRPEPMRKGRLQPPMTCGRSGCARVCPVTLKRQLASKNVVSALTEPLMHRVDSKQASKRKVRMEAWRAAYSTLR